MKRTIALLLLVGCADEERNIALMVSTEEPAPAIAETVRSKLDAQNLNVEVQTITDARDALVQVADGHLDLAIVEEPERPQPGLVTLAPLYPSVLHVLYDRTDETADFATLIRGADVYAGPSGGAAHRLLMQLAADFNVRNDEFQILDNPWTESPDVFFIFGGLLSDESLQQLERYRLFNFASTGDVANGTVADGIALRHHHLRPFLLPKGVYNQLTDTAVLTLSIRTVLVANENLDSEIAFTIAAELFRNAQDLSLSYPLVTRELDEAFDPGALMLPLHSGSRRYLDRDGPGYLERNVDLLALYLTIALAMISGLYAWFRRRSQLRKDRVDLYYAQLLDIRQDAATSGRADCKTRVLDVQREVFELLIDERIAADASLIAFINLSNQMINEFSEPY